MKKKELIALLSNFSDDDEILVEAWESGFDEPTIYVKAARPRNPADFMSATDSDYVADREGSGCVIIGTSLGCAKL
jgi:hypothetical protein